MEDHYRAEYVELAANLIKNAEGFSEKEYLCTAGKRTIGHGRNLETYPVLKDEEGFYYKDGELHWNYQDSYHWLIDRAFDLDETLIEYDFYYKCDSTRRACLIDMAYNLGISGLLKFKKMIAALESFDYETAANEAKDSNWYKQVKSRGVRNVKIIRTGEHDLA